MSHLLDRFTAFYISLWLLKVCFNDFPKALPTIPLPAVMDRAELERQDTIKSSDEPKQAAQTSAPPSAGFSECNPFAQEFDKGTQPLAQDMFTGDLPPPPAQDDLDKTLVNTENPFTVDMAVDQVTPVSSTPTIQPGIKPGTIYSKRSF